VKRIKRRYLLLEYEVDGAIEEHAFMATIWAAFYKLYGEHGASLANLAPINFDCGDKKAIIRTNLAVVDNIRTAIASITFLAGKPIAVHVTAVSGTIRGLIKKALS